MRVSALAVPVFFFGQGLAAPAPHLVSDIPQRRQASPQTSDGQSVASQRANAIRDAYIFAWDGYYQNAFPNDEVGPLSGDAINNLFGWGATPVDGLDTACVMQIPHIVHQILGHIPNIDFGKSFDNQIVTVFDSTIRYLGGLLAGYDLLSGPLAHLAGNRTDVKIILEQAAHLANNISYAFETPSGVPSNNLYLNNRSTDGSTTNNLAQVGSLVLEWTHLADLTGNQTYAALTEKAESYLLNPKPLKDQPFPGLVGSDVSINTGRFVDNDGGWVGGGDSYYEYLIKMYVYDSNKYGSYSTAWKKAADSAMTYLKTHPSSRPDLTYLAEFEGKMLQDDNQNLGCFDGGNYILAGTALGEEKYTNFGLKLVDACYNLYSSTVTGIGPETFSWNKTTIPANQAAFYKKHGYYITDSLYDLRPEVLESIHYAYRVTGDTKYQDWSWDIFTAINATCRTDLGFAQINNVNTKGGGGQVDNEDAFFFAETLKYSYLTQAPSAIYDTNYNGKNQYVFNTEGHTLKVAGTPV